MSQKISEASGCPGGCGPSASQGHQGGIQVVTVCTSASFSDWLSISVPHHAYEGDQVVIRCTGKNNGDIKRVKYFKNSHHIATYSGSSSYTIDNAGLGDSGYYFCKADRKLFLFIDTTEETGSKWLNVQGRGVILQVTVSRVSG